MPKLPLYNQLGETIGEIKLADSVFAAPMNQQVIYDVVKAQRASMRQGTAKTKSRSKYPAAVETLPAKGTGMPVKAQSTRRNSPAGQRLWTSAKRL